MTEAPLPAWIPPDWARLHWPERNLTDYCDNAVARHPDKAAIVDHNSMTGEAATMSHRQLQQLSRRIAGGLAARGGENGTIVACQLPNWWQFVALYLACARLGAILNPLMPIFRQRELRYMLGFAEAKILVVPRFFRNYNSPEMIAEIRGDLPRLSDVLVVGGNDDNSFERRLLDRRWEEDVRVRDLLSRRAPLPHGITQLLYTSGTIGEPKHVLHPSNPLLRMRTT